MALIGISGKIGVGKDTVGEIIQYFTGGYNWECSFGDYRKNLENHFGESWKIVKFADKLKDCVCLILGCTRQQLEDREFKEKELGEEWFKTIWWIKSNHNNLAAFNSIEEADEAFSYYDENYLEEVFIASEDVMLTPRLILQLLGTQCGRQIIHPDIWVTSTFTNYKGVAAPNGQPGGYIKYPNWIITDCRFPNEADAIENKGGINIRVNRLIGKRVYIISNEQPFENWYGEVESYNGNNFYNVINGVDDVVLVHKNQITLQDEHESEVALDDYEFDYVIENEGTIEDLIQKVKEILIKENII